MEEKGQESEESKVSKDPESTVYLQECFRKHKAEKLNKKKQRKQLISGNKKQSYIELRVDHNNRPHKWKDERTLRNEVTQRSRRKLMAMMQPAKLFPGKIRKRGPMSAEKDDVDEVSVAKSTSVQCTIDQQVAPRSCTPVENDEFLKLDQSNFPIDKFDSSEFDIRSPEEWLSICRTGTSLYYAKGDWRWRPCNILKFDKQTEKFTIQFKGTDRQKKVKRINLKFDMEDQANFQLRIDAACNRRDQAKAQLRFDHFIQQQSSQAPRPMGQKTLEGIHNKVIEGLASSIIIEEGESSAILLRDLTDFSIRDYTRNMQKAILWHRISRDADLRNKYMALKLIPIPEKIIAPKYGKKIIPQHQFSKNRRLVMARHFTAGFEFLSVLIQLYIAWEKSFVSLMFADINLESIRLPCRLADFQVLQTEHCNKTTETILKDWRRVLSESLVDGLQDIHDFFQSNLEVYDNSAIKRLLKSVSIRMSSQLRHITERTITEWVSFTITQSGALTPSPTNGELNPGYSINESIYIGIPLFEVELVLVNGKVEISPSPEDLLHAMLSPLENMVESIHGVDAIESDLMSLLSLPRSRLFDLELEVCTMSKLTKGKEIIRKVINEAMEGAKNVANEYEKHAYLMQVDPSSIVDNFRSRSRGVKEADKIPTIDEYCAEIRKFHLLCTEISSISFDTMEFNLVTVSTINIKKLLKNQAEQLKNSLIEFIVGEVRNQNKDITMRYEGILNRINEKPTNEAELAKLKEFVNESKEMIAEIVDEVSHIHQRIDSLSEFSYKLSEDDFKLAWSTKEWPRRVEYAADSCDSALEEDKVRMMDKLALEKDAFEMDLDRFENEVKSFQTYGEIDKTEKYVELAITLYDSLCEAKAKAEDFNSREAVFGFPPTEYSMLEKLDSDFEPYYKLWTMCSDFNHNKQAWLNGPFLELKGMEIEQLVTDWWKSSYKLSKTLTEIAPGSAEVALVLRERTNEFRDYLPVIQSLASPALRDRHWENLSQKIGESIEPDEELTLRNLLETGIADHINSIQEVCVVAEKEYSLEKNLNAMIGEWEHIELVCSQYRESGTYLLTSVDDVVALLDDHIVKTQTMRGSPFIKPIEKECRAWEKKLQYAQQLIDEWMTCQRTWLYLEPIFGSEDIMRQMPTEARRFASVDTLWRKTMEDTANDPNLMSVLNMDKLLQKFQSANSKLDEIQKGLNDYLEMKRLCFPRFFFLSNEELLEILSQTKEPEAVQVHLAKCFEGINRVTFDSSLIITQIVSAEGEVVELKTQVNPDSAKNKGNVEMWLLELETNQWETIRDHTERALVEYPTKERETWMLEWPAQVVLAASQVYWTQDVTDAIHRGGSSGLQDYVANLNKQLESVVYLVRGSLTKLQRTTIGALVVIDVHARDTILHMISHDVEHEHDFEWISQLRYYWLTIDPKSKACDLQARIVNARVKYGYEYLGNTMRLVITPLTDRCYRTMMGAVDLLYGGAPEGPAGTGKTETVKDLSKAIAIQCVVFNCSDGLDYLAMAKFFKGLAGCGSWCCFDEFNRINIEVLSVIAQQILTINEAKKANVDKFLFEGTHIRLIPSASVFITMNPGYAGRAELPDNLKALFRPCAMMVPDYALIAEIRLYSFGFSDARSNARKLTQVLQLSSEQLSSQKHYDYGMRAVNSILVAAGNLRQKLGNDPEWTEDKIVLRSVQDVNLPKFTTDDLPLFKGISSDLFPHAEIPNPDHGPLIPTILRVCVEGISISPDSFQTLQTKEGFIKKIVQLYETVLVRHGLMVVGQTGSGKSCVVHVLAAAMTLCYEESGGKLQNPVHIHTMNPKSITSGQLYGNFDENTHEWSDGVLACTYRECARDMSSDKQWVMFDGPVDAVWIENMNTVLDDNKKLCLMSGEIVKMTDRMTMMFETDDLEEASPATVSRVGMVYLEAKNLGWEPLLHTWLDTDIIASTDMMKEKHSFLKSVFHWLIPPMLFFVQKKCIMPTPITFLECVSSLLRLYSCLLDDSVKKYAKGDEDIFIPKTLECLLFQALIWSFGACVDDDSRKRFDYFFRELISGKITPESNEDYHYYILTCKPNDSELKKGEDCASRTALLTFPDGNLVYDYCFSVRKSIWVNWIDSTDPYIIPRNTPYNAILIPTIDTERNAWLVHTLLIHHYHVLCTGDTGTGKSVSIKKTLLSGLDASFSSIFMNFSAQTSANQTQDIIESKLDKRRKGVLGPPLGSSCIIFVDDLNMPAKETYGAQPPIELLRQWMGHGGWYNRKENTYTQLVDIQFIAAMGPPGGGRTQITQRYVRYFNVINFIPFDRESLQTIFSSIASWFLNDFSSSIKLQTAAIVQSTIDVYYSISENLLPTPAKSHYTFNLRDLSKVFQGISMCSAKQIETANDLIRMWSHECLRVFHDRLVDNTDRLWFHNIINEVVLKNMNLQYSEKIKGNNETLIYGNFGENKAYCEICDHDKLSNLMVSYLEDYNNMTAAPMSLVLFQNAIEHIARISRVIHQPYGNVLLVGVGGSGRKSLTTLAVSMADFKLCSIEISKSYSRFDWLEDLKKVLQCAGLKNEPCVFLFSDTQIVEEAFLEDINGILNTGEVANLWNNEELLQMNESLEKTASAENINTGNQSEMYNFFVSRCRTNLHVVLALSPIGDAFRRRLRMFPSLVNCCTIDWFTAWPENALRSVANHFFVDVDLPIHVKQGVIDVCVDMQKKVSIMSQLFLHQLRRHYYVTPTSYLELINTFKSLLTNKRVEVMQLKERYDNGLTKLVETAAQVEKMQVDLEALQPMLQVATVETDALLVTIAREQKEANITKEIVGNEEKECNEQAASANAIKESCEAELAEAIPALENSVKALQTLTKGDITEVKAMKKPPDGVKLVMETVCILMGVAPARIKDPNNSTKKIDDYWVPGQKNLLNDTRFLQNLMEYDKDNIDPAAIAKVKPYTEKPDFTPEKIKKASLAASGLCSWVHAMVVYDRVAKVVAPKRKALQGAVSDLEKAQSALKGKQEALQLVLDKVAKLESDLAMANKKKVDLQKQVDDCSAKLARANQLVGGLGGERVRWHEMSENLTAVYDNVVGDIVLSSGLIAYLGAFTSVFREDALAQWSALLCEKAIPCSKEFKLVDTLGDLVQIRAWTIAKLPNDSFSIDNGIMLFRSNRWPLMIDPQGQANRWVRNLEEQNELKIVKQSQVSFVRSLENAITFGNPVLIENIPEEIDPIIEPVLLKHIVKSGGILTIRLGDNTIEYDPKFKLYITTKLTNPHYPPETCVKVNLLNFMATEDGLQDQMLGIVVAKEEPSLELQRQKLVLEDAENKKTLKEVEDCILHLLQEAEGNILEDETLIDTLAASKVTANKIEEKVREAAVTQRMIAEKREGYTPVAFHASQLFFCIADLAGIDPMYQYALEWFINLFICSIDKANKSPDLGSRLHELNSTFTFMLYVNVCRSLFEKDKLLFSFLLTVKILLGKNDIDTAELRYFFTGNTAMELSQRNPNPKWLSDKTWGDILGLSTLAGFKDFDHRFVANLPSWEICYNSTEPVESLKNIPRVKDYFNTFQQLVILRCFRPDKVIPAVMNFVAESMGQRFIEPQPFDLMAGYDDSSCATPLIFVLTPGADPMSELLKLANELGFSKKFVAISLGQGQGPLAENAIAEAVDNGNWVCLQNCHLCVSWLPTLERICEEISPDRVHANFRLWLTSEPSNFFPPFILQNGVKMTNEPPKGMRANLKGSYLNLDEEYLSTCSHSREFKKLLFGLCFFHATVRERTKFGPLGWNIKYVFSGSDLNISKDQLRIFLDDLAPSDPIPYEALAYLAGECNYGGRVTDDKDRRCIVNILSDFYSDKIIDDNYKFSPSGIYYAPKDGSFSTYLDYINSLPMNEEPEIFGLHENANISCAIAETTLLLDSALSLQPRSSGGSGKSWDESLSEVSSDIISKMPHLYDMELAEKKFPVLYEESMNTVLTQELLRFNRLLQVIKRSLEEIQRAIKGLVVMSGELENMGSSMVNGQVPEMWSSIAYPSLKPLGGWVGDFLQRLKFLGDWFQKGEAPSIYWISGFFFTQAFITGTLQNFARKYQLPIDQVGYDMVVLTKKKIEGINCRADDGAYINGLFMEGARWDDSLFAIAESRHRELHVPMPIILLLPKKRDAIEPVKDVVPNGTAHVYMCPVYKTSLRQGSLSTTGHSTNFVMFLRIPMGKQHNQKHWIRRGVALLTQLDT